MDELRIQYPDLKEEVYSLRMDSLRVWGLNLVLSFAIPLFFLVSGLSQRINLAVGQGKNLFLSGLLYGAIFFILVFLINLPINFYSSFYLRHRYGLTDQTFLRWMELNIKGFLVNDLVIILFLWIPYHFIYRSPKSWWLKLGILFIPVVIFMVFISPFLIDPIFNKYTSIENEVIGQKIDLLLERAGIEDAQIYMVDKSKDTKTMNAYMTGIFKSKRIVLWDTTINNLTEEEVLSITSHEIGHYVKGHIWKNILYSSVGTILILYLVFITSRWILKASGGSFGFRNLYNYASLPLLLLLLNLFTFLGTPVSSYISRTMEVEADSYEISLTQTRMPAVTAMQKLYETSLGIPRPSKIYKLWYYTHPPLEERIEFYKTADFEKIR
jgi:Zn-dependent protease with chaperone function